MTRFWAKQSPQTPKSSDPTVSHSGVSTLVMFACALSVGLFALWRHRPDTLWPYALIFATTISAAMVQLLLSPLLPALFGAGPPRFPRNLTLPIVYVALLMMCAVMWTSSGAGGSSLVRAPDVFDALALWQNPLALLCVAALQFAALSALARSSR